jgi:hypothetical protein
MPSPVPEAIRAAKTCVERDIATPCRRELRNSACAFRSVSLHGLRSACLSYDAQVAALGQWQGPLRRFAAARGTRELRMLRIRIEDNGPFAAFRWRGVTGEDAALAQLGGVAAETGLAVRWACKVLEVRLPVPTERGSRCATLWWRADRMWRSSAAAT